MEELVWRDWRERRHWRDSGLWETVESVLLDLSVVCVVSVVSVVLYSVFSVVSVQWWRLSQCESTDSNQSLGECRLTYRSGASSGTSLTIDCSQPQNWWKSASESAPILESEESKFNWNHMIWQWLRANTSDSSNVQIYYSLRWNQASEPVLRACAHCLPVVDIRPNWRSKQESSCDGFAPKQESLIEH